MNRSFLSYHHNGSKIYYSEFGDGEKVMLVFHGFGHTLKSMRPIEDIFSKEYKIYSFDLFYHGFSEWNHDDNPLTFEIWNQMITGLIEKHKIKTFTLIGYSLGARVALSTLQLFPERIDNLYLLAPDGIKKHFWYELATTTPFSGIFRKVVIQPRLFYFLIGFMKTLKLMDKRTLLFSALQMNSNEKRRRVYYSWMVYRGLAPSKDKIIEIVNNKAIPVHLYSGKYDRIVRPEEVEEFSKKLKNATYKCLEAGHFNLLDEVISTLEIEFSKTNMD